MIETTTSTPIPAPVATEPGTPVAVTILVQVGNDRTVPFSVDARARHGVDPYLVADSLAGALREQVGIYICDQRYGRVPTFTPGPCPDNDDPPPDLDMFQSKWDELEHGLGDSS